MFLRPLPLTLEILLLVMLACTEFALVGATKDNPAHCNRWKAKCDLFQEHCSDGLEIEHMQSCCESGRDDDLSKFKSGVYSVDMSTFSSTNALCDMTTNDSGWMVIARRSNPKTNFDRLYHDYKQGFGDLQEDFWFGLQSLQMLTSKRPYELKLDMFSQRDDTEPTAVARYSSFEIVNPNYTLKLGNFTGSDKNLLDNMMQFNGQPFAAKKDSRDTSDICFTMGGGWWYLEKYCSSGLDESPGTILTTRYDELGWYDLSNKDPYITGRFFEKYELKMRPKDCETTVTGGI